MRTLKVVERRDSSERSFFRFRATSALIISVVADSLDYFAAPLFGTPVLGDIADAIIISLLFNITRSKVFTAVNMIEFIPFVGDYVPVYTLSTLMWILKEIRMKKKNTNKKRIVTATETL
jgi:hypothetical protein